MSIPKTLLSALLIVGTAGACFSASAAPSAEVTLQGIVTNTTCDITVNGGKSTLNIGVQKASAFSAANTQVGSVPLNVTLSGCTVDETGSLIVQGVTSTANNDKNLFVSASTDTVGFMLRDAAGKQISTASKTSVSATKAAAVNYAFSVGMGSAKTTATAGSYSAPVVVAYIVN